MKLLSTALILFSITACTQPKKAPSFKSKSNETAGSDTNTNTNTGGNSDDGDALPANDKQSKQFYFMDSPDTFVCTSVVFESPVSEARAGEGGMKPGTCPTTNSLNATVVQTCDAVPNAASQSSMQALIFSKGKDDQGATLELSKGDATAVCASIKANIENEE